MPSGERITDVAAVSAESTLLVTVAESESGEQREAILVQTETGVKGWFNYCQHWRDVNFDQGDGAMIRDGELVCTRHGATFETDDGECTFGPCEGAVLDELAVQTTDEGVFLDSPAYELVHVGPAEEDDDDDIDLSTESRIGF
ncbi:Rieske (2Fe-2S) iron-sulfur domain-containing protein [halophilic archaeon DL31]|jgi:nitrite reductase/ring-hydroxylating ferredoxin subunit|nr:Rieske (2Fe-2S) iron-sulfur domain-containing protein [halophilic archaeon DL31]